MNKIAEAEIPGLTKAQNPIQIVVLIAVSISVWTLYMVPPWQAPALVPCVATSWSETPADLDTACGTPNAISNKPAQAKIS